jgi:NAD(P)-dependent dehydrogenase (short-subunit alcohol dehydrogenase family)
MQDQVVFITGAARGIGAALARGLAAKGARVALTGREPELLERLARELGPRHVWYECDVTRQDELTRAVEATVHELGGIDVVVANAGIASHGTLAITPVDALARVIDVNLTGVIRTVHATLPHVVARRGYYLLVSSAAAFAPQPGMAAYAASKAGVEQFGNVLRQELLCDGVSVGVAHPSWIDTDLVRDAQADLPSFPRTLRKLPGPFGKVTTLETCTSALVDAVVHRRRKVYVPKGLRPFAAMRHLFMSKLGDLTVDKAAQKRLQEMESEVRALGRVFGAHSAETRD